MERYSQPVNDLGREDLAVILGLFLTEGIGARTLHRVLFSGTLATEGFNFLRENSAEAIALILNLPIDLITKFVDARPKGRDLRDQLEQLDVDVLVEGTNSYPQHLSRRLGTKSPPILFVHGNRSILTQPSVGFCGSRRASVTGLEISSKWSAVLAKHDINVIAGYAQGVDLAAHLGALNAGGTTTLVLAEGITHFRMKSPLHEVSSPENTVVISEFPPGISWATHNAMTRNYTICGLSSAMILVESGKSGGTFQAGKVAMQIGCPLFVADRRDSGIPEMGNQYFIDRGATPVGECDACHTNLKDVLIAAEMADWPQPRQAAPQDELFGPA